MAELSLIDMVEAAAEIRKDIPVPRGYIATALEKIEEGEIDLERYPMGSPSLKEVYSIASKLYEEDSKVN